MSRHSHLWKDHEVFTTSLASDSEEVLSPKTEHDSGETNQQQQYGPGTLGCTYELCAGIVDKRKSLEQIALDEICEETGEFLPHMQCSGCTAVDQTLSCMQYIHCCM